MKIKPEAGDTARITADVAAAGPAIKRPKKPRNRSLLLSILNELKVTRLENTHHFASLKRSVNATNDTVAQQTRLLRQDRPSASKAVGSRGPISRLILAAEEAAFQLGVDLHKIVDLGEEAREILAERERETRRALDCIPVLPEPTERTFRLAQPIRHPTITRRPRPSDDR